MQPSSSLPAVSAGLLAAFVGFTSSFAVILQGLAAVGASHAQAASGLMALSIAMGAGGILLSLKTRMPISVAWSTPGAALLATSGLPEGGFPAAVGAFVLAGVLVVLAGVFRPLGRMIARIPTTLANAMLAGILLSLCLAPVKAVAADPASGLLIFGTWLLVSRLRRVLAAPLAALVAIAVILFKTGEQGIAAIGGHERAIAALLPHPVFVVPDLTLAAALGLALPLFLVTMASQNIPGLAVLKVHGYEPAPGPLFCVTGIFSLLAAPFGAVAVNLAAITAAICAGPEAGPDRDRRFVAGVVSGMAYIVFGLCAGIVTAFAGLSPLLVQAVGGLALMGAFAASVNAAMAEPDKREAATLTFLVTASGTTIAGVSAPFLGLLAGGFLFALGRMAKRRAADPAAASPVKPGVS